MAASRTPGQQVLSFVVDALGEGAKAAVHSWLQRASTASSRPYQTTVQETPPGASGCPFCFIAARLAVAYRYLRRGKTSPSHLRIYQELAVDEIGEASYLATAVTHEEHGDYALTLAINRLEVALSKPLTPATLEPLLTEIWMASEAALRIAERNQFGMPSPPEADNVVEGEAREVS